MPAKRLTAGLLLLLAASAFASDQVITGGDDLDVDVNPADGRIAMELAGAIWLLPARGGVASRLTDGIEPSTRPRWSPDGRRLLYQARGRNHAETRLIELPAATVSRVGDDDRFMQDPAWHPDGERVVFAADGGVSGLDLWEIDLPTGLSWRLISNPGDELEPAWSSNGRHLAWISRRDDHYALVLRRRGEREIVLTESDVPLSSPSWRPDGSLITYLRHGEETTLEMVILSTPPLARRFADDEDFLPSPVSWIDRHRFVYAADGEVKTREFSDRRGTPLYFRAVLAAAEPPPPLRAATAIKRRELEIVDPPVGRLVIRGTRLFDGIWPDYRPQMDVLIEGGRIVAVEERRAWPETTVLELGDVTILPGFIDAWSAAPADAAGGARLLSYGITTLVSADGASGDPEWHGETSPGPRVLTAAGVGQGPPAAGEPLPYVAAIGSGAVADSALREAVTAWQAAGIAVLAERRQLGLAAGADLVPGEDSPVGDEPRTGPETISISALADAATPGIDTLLGSRQARWHGHVQGPRRRYPEPPRWPVAAGRIVAGSKANGLPPGPALHAELRALAAAGLPGNRVLLAAGHEAALMFGVDNQVGRITPGALADLVLVAGDPLGNAADALSIVAVIRNGRFFSLVSLLERSSAAATVE